MVSVSIMASLLLVPSLCLSQEKDRNSHGGDPAKDIPLIVYLSRTGNTEALAQIIQNQVGGELLALELLEPYPEDYRTTVDQVARENASGFLPPLRTKVDLGVHNPIYIGFPTWGMQLPPPIKSFLRANDLSGKTVIPFNTHAGYGSGSAFDDLGKLCPNSEVLNGLSLKGGIERDSVLLTIKGTRKKEVEQLVRSWLRQIHSSREKQANR